MGKTKYESLREKDDALLFALRLVLIALFALFFSLALYVPAWPGEIEELRRKSIYPLVLPPRADEIEELHRKILYPTVRVRAGGGVGSGVIFASIPAGAVHQTYILTNHHVIAEAIQIQEEWSPLEKKEIKKETRATIEVEQFKYQFFSQATGTLLIQADILEWNKQQDLALVRLRSDERIESVNRYPRGRENELRIFMDIYICGAGMGRPPFPTRGQISSLREEIDNLPYWQINAPIVFGNSGGGAFLAGTQAYIGIPSRIGITWVGWSPQAVYHMGYIIPISRIYQWLEETGWGFVFDPKAPSREQWVEKQKDRKK